ncbi:ABC transporter substrate-binding protein [Skermania piniformis]|uniref:ABC transporter substrate-binding protein n=1 Tax=Skermania pinensis TaxID=39122 RepID=A0ABX8S7M0_9ACTN|nr:ABC transporter substrate-binding protein [Skermania piniformis]QXQ13822.1 ABC transporter substrate-binding protein [Skermania piniformis]
MIRSTTGDRRRTRPRRWLAALAVGLVSLGVLVGCSSSSDSTDTSDSSAGGAFPVTIDHKFGSTTVDAEPTSVVTVGWNDQDFALALGVVPVATRSWYENYSSFPWVQAALGGKDLPTMSGDEINFEEIAQRKPDLILAIYETIDKKTYDRLSEIAPTVVQSGQYPDEETPWDVQTLTTGKALGRTDQATALVAEVQSKIDAAKAANPEFAGKTLVEDFGTEGEYVLAAGDPRRALFDALGFAAQPEVGDISQERLDVLNRDVLFVNGRTKQQMLGNELFARLPVVTEDRTLYAGNESALSGALAYGGPQALLYATDRVVPQLANALDGNPATPVEDLSNS